MLFVFGGDALGDVAFPRDMVPGQGVIGPLARPAVHGQLRTMNGFMPKRGGVNVFCRFVSFVIDDDTQWDGIFLQQHQPT